MRSRTAGLVAAGSVGRRQKARRPDRRGGRRFTDTGAASRVDKREICGRDRQFADLEELVFGAGDASNSGVVLCGERGVGKTALWDGFLARVGDRAVVSRLIATEAARSIPFAAVAPLLGQLPRSSLNEVEVLGIAFAAFRELAGGRRLLIAVDDVDLLDDASATVIDHLVRSGEVTLVSTLASDDPLIGWLGRLVSLERARQYEVRPLDRSGVVAMLSALLGGDVDTFVESELWRLSAGNPLVVRQLVATSLDSGVLAEGDRGWSVEGEFVATGQLGELLDRRLAARSADEVAVLEFAAVGGLVELDLLESVRGPAVVETLEAADLVRVERDGGRMTAGVRHPLLSERIVRSMPVTRRRRIRKQMGEWVAVTGSRRVGDTLRVATWELEAGRQARPAIAARAARQALDGADSRLAERLARAALAAGAGFEAQLTLGEALFDQGRSDEADGVLRGAQAVAQGDGEVARAAVVRCQVLALGRADLVSAVEVATAAASGIDEPDWVDEVAVEVARVALAAGDPMEAVRLGQQIAVRESASARAVVAGLVVTAAAQVMLCRISGAIEDANRGLGFLDAGAVGPLLARDRLLLAKTEALLWSGRLAEAIPIAAERCEIEPATSGNTGMWQAVYARATLLTGDVAGACSGYDDSVATLTRYDPLSLLARARARSALAAAHAGDVAAVEEVLAGIDAELIEADYRVAILVKQAAAWIEALQGDTEAASRLSLKAGLAAIDHNHVSMGALALHDAVRFGHPGVVIADLKDLSDRFEGVLLPAVLHQATALFDNDGAGLDAVTGTYASIGADLFAAESSNQAATAHRSTGDHHAARRSEARADALIARCAGARTPAIERRAPLLTKRQDQIARLAIDHTNAEIAARLHVSVRTVESHLHTVFHTLGIHTRADLAATYDPAPRCTN